MSVSFTRNAFDQFVKPLRPALLRYAARRCGRAEAQDIVQDALVLCFQQWDHFTVVLTSAEMLIILRPYLHAACQKFLRRARNSKEIMLPAEEVLAQAERGDPPDISGDIYLAQREVFYVLLDRVPLTPLQEICIRMWVDGHTQPQIATHLGISQQTVARHIQAGAKRIRESRPECVDIEVREIIQESMQAPEHNPSAVWDRNGNSAQIDKRRMVPALEAYDRRQEKKAQEGGR